MQRLKQWLRKLAARWLDLELPEDRRDYWPGVFKGTWTRQLTADEIDRLERRYGKRRYLVRPRQWR